MNDLFISMEYNAREFDGIEEFKSEMENNYQFQLRSKYIPACSEGAEFWTTIYINSELAKFLISAIAGGLVWDLIKVGSKKYVFEPFFKALEKLNSKNKKNWNGIKVLKLKFQFDDCDIYVGGLNKNFTSVISSVFQEISKKKPLIEKRTGLNIIKIEMPIEKDDREGIEKKYVYQIDVYNEDYSIEAYKKLWKLTFATDWPIMVYNFADDSLIDIYEEK